MSTTSEIDGLLERPVSLSARGNEAYDTIMRAMKWHRGREICTHGSKAFYSPKNWRRRGERYGLDSVLIVVHEGGDVAPFFDGYDGEAEEFMRQALDEHGLWAERCTAWYSAIYDGRPSV